jgi:putative acetyltransferase
VSLLGSKAFFVLQERLQVQVSFKSSIRPAESQDLVTVLRVVEAAFGDEGPQVARMVEALDASGNTRASLVAEVDGEVVGHVQLSRSWVDARQALVEVLVLSPLSVAPAHQGQGVGTALLEAAVAEAERLGVPAVFLEGDPGFYGGRGWAPGHRHGLTRPSVRIPEPAFQVMVFATREEWMTGALVYCEPFWALDCVGLRDPLLAQLGG